MKYDVYFKEKVIRKFIDESDWHPAIGQDYYRPLDLSVRGFYAKCMNDGYDLPNTDLASSKVLSIPIHSGLSEDDVQNIGNKLNDVLKTIY